MITRRSIFALFGGAVAAPLVKHLPVAAEPEIISQTWQWKGIALPTRIAMADNITRNNALLALLEKKMRIASEKIAIDMSDKLYGDG